MDRVTHTQGHELAHKVRNACHKRQCKEYKGKNKRPCRHICSPTSLVL